MGLMEELDLHGAWRPTERPFHLHFLPHMMLVDGDGDGPSFKHSPCVALMWLECLELHWNAPSSILLLPDTLCRTCTSACSFKMMGCSCELFASRFLHLLHVRMITMVDLSQDTRFQCSIMRDMQQGRHKIAEPATEPDDVN
ncbi:hypothetical protein C1H46_002139 [Malus baccata]|uniref:Uncharacterized protein n=1 Tax=Malus baccata TaxID=106549 RepID=A0A540NMH6_MALBA|nr:hypothetical protein C1H46_002139 [Malus baccata]